MRPPPFSMAASVSRTSSKVRARKLLRPLSRTSSAYRLASCCSTALSASARTRVASFKLLLLQISSAGFCSLERALQWCNCIHAANNPNPLTQSCPNAIALLPCGHHAKDIRAQALSKCKALKNCPLRCIVSSSWSLPCTYTSACDKDPLS